MGWVKRSRHGNWRAAYRDPDKREVSKTFALKRDAESWLRQHEGRIDEGTYLDPRRAKKRLGEYWAESFLAGKPVRPGTRARYEVHWRLYLEPAFGDRALGSITPADVRTWRADLLRGGRGEATVEAATRLLKTVLNRAVADELIARSPARHVPNPATAPEGGLRVLELEELSRLAAAVPARYAALITLLGARGLRIGEATALRVGDLDLMRGKLSVKRTLNEIGGELVEGPPKTDAGRRVVSLPGFLRDMLTAHVAAFSDPKDPTAYVFTSAGGGPGRKAGEGGPIRANNFRKRTFARAVRDAGLDPNMTPHDLRDTAATLAFADGASVKEVQRMLGHAKAAITLDRYTGVLESMAARTDERLDARFRELEANPAAPLRPLAASEVVALPASGS
jgi:integrase